MPTYEYRCPKCGHRFESFQSINDPDADCPVCGTKAARLISAGAGLLFKGSGFYITDHRSKEYKEKVKLEKQGGVADKTGKKA